MDACTRPASLDPVDEDVLARDVSDEALEAAAGRWRDDPIPTGIFTCFLGPVC